MSSMSAFHNLMYLKHMKDEGATEEDIQRKISAYWADYNCIGRTSYSEVLPGEKYVVKNEFLEKTADWTDEFGEKQYGNMYYRLLTNYEETLDGLGKLFSEYMQGKLDEYEKAPKSPFQPAAPVNPPMSPNRVDPSQLKKHSDMPTIDKNSKTLDSQVKTKLDEQRPKR